MEPNDGGRNELMFDGSSGITTLRIMWNSVSEVRVKVEVTHE